MSHRIIDSRFADIIEEYAPVRQIATGCVFTEGPIWHPKEHHLLFSDIPGDVRRKWTPDGQVREVQRPANKGNGMTYDADLNLLICEHATSSVARLRPDGTREILCSHYQGRELNSPNDIVVGNNGAVYFTDPTYGRMEHFGIPRPVQQGFQGVYMLPPGHRPGDEPVLVVDKYLFSQPNGLTFSPCQRWMWVNDSDQFNIRLFDVASDGQLTNGRMFASGIKEAAREGMPDGMKADVDGNLYVTGPGGIWVFSFEGIKLGEIETPEKPANLHWGGADWQTLFITATTGVYAVDLKTRGRIEPFMHANAVGAPSSAPNGPSSAASHAARPAAPAPAARNSPALRLDGGRCALILQDLQNDVIIEGGAFAGSGSPEHARAQNVVANAARLAAACRNAGVMVIHVHFICEPGHPHLTNNAPLFQGVKGENALVRGTWGAAAVDGLQPSQGDLVVEKMSMSAWETSRLESYLRHGGRDTIINAGAWTNMSVEHTARTGADKGFRIVLPEDACSTMNADWHRASIDYAMSNVAEISSTDAVIAALR